MSDAPHPPRAAYVPEDGPMNPVFAAVEARDVIQATLLFSPQLTDRDVDVVERAVLAWFGSADWGDAVPELRAETLTVTALHLAVTGLRSARAALASLVASVEGAGVGVGRAVFARVHGDRDRDALVRAMDGAGRGQARYDDERAWWEACFDLGAVPPLSEDVEGLAGDENALVEIDDTTFVEQRGLPLHVDGHRVCWGLAPLSFVDADERTADVARHLGEALRDRFDALAPTPYDRLLRGGRVDRIVADGRVGYACGFRAADLREYLHDHSFRYRESELMLAARDVARALVLEPVVCWRRFEGRYVLEMWERSGARVGAAA